MRADLIAKLRKRADDDEPDFTDADATLMREAADALASQEPVEPLYILSASLRKNIPNGHLSSMMLGWRRGFTEDAAKGSFLSTIQQDKPGFSVVELLCTQVHASPVVPIAAKAEAEGWRPIETAPKDGTPIVGWCVHEADDYHTGDGILTDYGCHAEALSRVQNGPNILVWGGGDSDYDELAGKILTWPDWWFRFGSELEEVANPTHWMPLPAAPTREGEGQ